MSPEANAKDTGISFSENDVFLSKGQRHSLNAIKAMVVNLVSDPKLEYMVDMLAEQYLWFINALSEDELRHPAVTQLMDKLGDKYDNFIDEVEDDDLPGLRNIVLPNIE